MSVLTDNISIKESNDIIRYKELKTKTEKNVTTKNDLRTCSSEGSGSDQESDTITKYLVDRTNM